MALAMAFLLGGPVQTSAQDALSPRAWQNDIENGNREIAFFQFAKGILCRSKTADDKTFQFEELIQKPSDVLVVIDKNDTMLVGHIF